MTNQGHSSTDINVNGEALVMRHLFERRLLDHESVVFDVGANEGDWTEQLLRQAPGAKVHSFEPNPVVSQRLKERFASKPNVTVFGEAISESTGLRENPRVIAVNTETMDEHCARTGIAHIHFLRISVNGTENSVFRGAEHMLHTSRVDAIQFEYSGTFRDAGETLEETFRILRGHGYEIFHIQQSSLLHLPEWRPEMENYSYCNMLAVQERLGPLLAQKKPVMLDLAAWLGRYGENPTGIIHVGAHEGEEVQMYQKMGISRQLMVEANPKVYEKLLGNIAGMDGCTAVCCAASDSDGEVELHLASMDQSSSILPLAKHKEIYPQIVDNGTIRVPSQTIDRIVRESGIPAGDLQFLCLDIQGAELLALRGASETLAHVRGVLTEVNLQELYKGAPGIEALDELLATHGFHRVATTCPYHPSWGDALYLRKERDATIVNPFDLPGTIITKNVNIPTLAEVRKLMSVVVGLHRQGRKDKALEALSAVVRDEDQLNSLITFIEPHFLKNPKIAEEGVFLDLLNSRFPQHLIVVMLLGKVLEKAGDNANALKCYKVACRILPGLGEPFTRSLLLQIPGGRTFQPKTAEVATGASIGLPFLGLDGRFANQLFQYSFARCYAEKFGLRLQTPEWVGSHMFGLEDELPTDGLPLYRVENNQIAALLGRNNPTISNCHMTGFFNQHSGAFAPFRDRIRDFVKPRSAFADAAARFLDWLHASGGPVVALHLRRGDFGYDKFWIAPEQWYLNWLKEIRETMPNARLYLATDAPSMRKAFASFQPVLQCDSHVDLGDFNFYLDFLALSHADAVGISNSTFSFFASMLNSRAKVFVRPDPKAEAMRPFDPWNSTVLLEK